MRLFASLSNTTIYSPGRFYGWGLIAAILGYWNRGYAHSWIRTSMRIYLLERFSI